MKSKFVISVTLFVILNSSFLVLNSFSQWEPDVRLTNNDSSSYTTNNAWSVASSGSLVHVVWTDERDGNAEIYYKRSTDSGVSWGTDTRLTNNTGYSQYPSVAISGSVVHVVWEDTRAGNIQLYCKRSTNAGVIWGADTRLTNNSAGSYSPSIAVSGSLVHVVWYDGRDGNREIYYKRSTDAGVSWGTDTRLTNNTSYKEYPSVAVSGSFVHVAWKDERDGNTEVYYKRSTDSGINWGADTRLTNNTAYSSIPSVAVSGLVVHVVWTDERDGNYEIYYKRNPTGNPTDIQNISAEIPSAYSLGQNYPNPFNPLTKIRFSIPAVDSRVHGNDRVLLKVYDIMGREVQTLVNESLQPGTYEATFDGSNLTSGIYFYRLQTKGFTDTKKLILLK